MILKTALWQSKVTSNPDEFLFVSDETVPNTYGFSSPLAAQLQPAFSVRSTLLRRRVEIHKISFRAYYATSRDKDGDPIIYSWNEFVAPCLTAVNLFVNGQALLPVHHNIAPEYVMGGGLDEPVIEAPLTGAAKMYAPTPFYWENIGYKSDVLSDIGLTAQAIVDFGTSQIHLPVIAQVDFCIID